MAELENSAEKKKKKVRLKDVCFPTLPTRRDSATARRKHNASRRSRDFSPQKHSVIAVGFFQRTAPASLTNNTIAHFTSPVYTQELVCSVPVRCKKQNKNKSTHRNTHKYTHTQAQAARLETRRAAK